MAKTKKVKVRFQGKVFSIQPKEAKALGLIAADPSTNYNRLKAGQVWKDNSGRKYMLIQDADYNWLIGGIDGLFTLYSDEARDTDEMKRFLRDDEAVLVHDYNVSLKKKSKKKKKG